MIPLLRKELAELLPLLLGILVAAAIWVAAHLTQPLAAWPVSETLEYLVEDWSIFATLAAFAAGHSRVGPEFLVGTVHFLDGLPISRFRMYLVKAFSGLVPLGLIVVITFVVKAWALSLWAGPAVFDTLVIAAWTTLHVALLAWAFYGAGLFLSWFGALGWAAMFTFAGGFLILTIISPPLRSWMPLFSGVVDLVWVNGGPLTSWGPLLTWTLAGGMGLLLSGGLFLGPGEKLVQTGSAWAQVVRIAVFAVPGCGLMFVGALSGTGLLFALPAFFQSTWRADTEHFRFLAYASDRETAEQVVADAEGLYQGVAEQFGAEGPERIDVELTGSAQHYAGLSLRGKIQMRQDAGSSVLAHELSHTFSQHIRGQTGGQDAWRFYEEGLATWMEEAVTGVRDAPASAAGAWRTGQHDWLMLFEDDRRTRIYDPDQAYPLGAVWADAVADATDGSPTCLVMASLEVDTKADGAVQWFHMLQACGAALPEVVAAYEARLVDSDGHLADGSIRIRQEGWSVIIEPTIDNAVACRMRDNYRDERELYKVIPVSGPDNRCEVPLFSFNRRSFDIQLAVLEEGETVHLPWHRVSVPPPGVME